MATTWLRSPELAAVCDILLPLDPHRFLFLTGITMLDDPRKCVDHRVKFDGGLGLALSERDCRAAG